MKAEEITITFQTYLRVLGEDNGRMREFKYVIPAAQLDLRKTIFRDKLSQFDLSLLGNVFYLYVDGELVEGFGYILPDDLTETSI